MFTQTCEARLYDGRRVLLALEPAPPHDVAVFVRLVAQERLFPYESGIPRLQHGIEHPLQDVPPQFRRHPLPCQHVYEAATRISEIQGKFLLQGYHFLIILYTVYKYVKVQRALQDKKNICIFRIEVFKGHGHALCESCYQGFFTNKSARNIGRNM